MSRFCSDRIASLLGWCKTCRKCAVLQRRPVTLKLLLQISAISPELRLHNSVPAKCVLAATNVHLAATAWCFVAAKMGEFCSNKVSFVATKLPLDFAASRLKPSKCCAFWGCFVLLISFHFCKGFSFLGGLVGDLQGRRQVSSIIFPGGTCVSDFLFLFFISLSLCNYFTFCYSSICEYCAWIYVVF